MLWHCLWIAVLPLAALGQTYYINFVFNNNQYRGDKDSPKLGSQESESKESRTIESSSKEHSRQVYHRTTQKPKLRNCDGMPSNTDEECLESGDLSQNEREKETSKKSKPTTEATTTTAAEITTTKGTTTAAITKATTAATTTTESTSQSKTEIEQWLSSTAHPGQFFDYPQAKCHEEMNLFEVFGLALSKDRGLPSKVLCEFDNDWAGPWLLMYRMELPTRIHMRHWYFGYITDDYLDLNINFLALAHLANNMRLALLIIGQDNNNELVYNLYDDFVVSGFNDLFMLRKAHLIESNTTDLMFSAVGKVLVTDPGRNRSCPFLVLGAWWDSKWGDLNQGSCVFPVERNIHRPGYVAFFIKPSPFKVNNTAFYNSAVTTRRPWVTSPDPILMAKARNNRLAYDSLKENEFLRTKKQVKDELNRRAGQIQSIEERHREEEQMAVDVKILTTIDRSMAGT